MSDAWKREVEAAIEADDPDELLGVVIDIALAADDAPWAEARLTTLAEHPHTDVRGNALMALAHLATRFDSAVDRSRIVARLRAARSDGARHVREQAEAALDELGEDEEAERGT